MLVSQVWTVFSSGQEEIAYLCPGAERRRNRLHGSRSSTSPNTTARSYKFIKGGHRDAAAGTTVLPHYLESDRAEANSHSLADAADSENVNTGRDPDSWSAAAATGPFFRFSRVVDGSSVASRRPPSARHCRYVFAKDDDLPAGEVVTADLALGDLFLLGNATPHCTTENLSEVRDPLPRTPSPLRLLMLAKRSRAGVC